MKKILFLIFLVMFGCSKKEATEETVKNYYYDPKIPFGTIDSLGTSVMDVQNLQANTSVLDQITLTWTLPPIYSTLNYKVMIYKRREVPASFTLPNPAEESSGAEFYLYKSTKDSLLLDKNALDANGDPENNIEQNIYYTYWLYVVLDDKNWSKGVKIEALSKTPKETFQLPSVSQFWLNKKWTLALAQTYIPQNNTYLNSVQTASTGIPTVADPRGRTAFGLMGNVMYYADTENNRVVIYKRDGAISCVSMEDEDEKAACLLNYGGSPLTAYNVLGQSNTSNSFLCGDPLNPLLMNECLSHPTAVQVIGDKLFISDTGNNRIVVFDTLPMNGCDANITPGYVLKKECTPNWVIGKAGLFDTNNNYTLQNEGGFALNRPTDVAAYDGDLYIADTLNNRIVRINDYSNKSLYNCQTDTWGTPTCKFSTVFGQPDFYSNISLESVYANDHDFVLNTPSKTNINPLYQNFTKRFFRYPTRIVFNQNLQMMVLSNESLNIPNEIGGYATLRSRINVFNLGVFQKTTGTCNSATFYSTGCDSSIIIGQDDPEKLHVVASLNDSAYDQLNSGLSKITDFDIYAVKNADDDELPAKELLLATNASNNSIYVWKEWNVTNSPGFPAETKILDPDGVVNTSTGYLMPDLQNLCGVRIEPNQKNIYVSDCYPHGGHVYEIQSYVVPTQ